MSRFDLSTSRALWNRDRLDLESDEVLAQLLDRGELEAWREIYRLVARDDTRGPPEECEEAAGASAWIYPTHSRLTHFRNFGNSGR
jgi:hypothetical protein